MAARIVSDSSSDLFGVEGVDYTTVPLKIMFGGVEYIDEPGTDVEAMVLKLQEHKGPSTTSCPNVHEWLEAFEGADEVYAVTISDNLSGSCAAAHMACDQYVRENPNAKTAVFDSKATGPVLRLIIEKLRDLMAKGLPFEDVVAATREYQESLRILYSLESLENLARNGRVNSHVARIAGALNIRVVGHASDEGTVELLHTCRGEKRALKAIVNEMYERGFVGGTVHIDHSLNVAAAEKVKKMVLELWPEATVTVNPCGALCSYYADKGGLIIGYEVDELAIPVPTEDEGRESLRERIHQRLQKDRE